MVELSKQVLAPYFIQTATTNIIDDTANKTGSGIHGPLLLMWLLQ